MEITATFNQQTLSATKTTDIWKNAEANRYGINMLVLALAIIPGSMAAPYAVNLGDWQCAMVLLFPSVFTLILVMGLAPIRMIVYTGAFALLMNLVMFLAGAIS
jgi:uncharacterized MAPEG superfamily protein